MVRDPDPSHQAGLSSFLVETGSALCLLSCICPSTKCAGSSGELPLRGLVSTQGAQEPGREGFLLVQNLAIGLLRDSKHTTGFLL